MSKSSSRRQTVEKWRKIVADFRDSGLSAQAFAKQVGVYPQRLSYWKARFQRETTPDATAIPAFVPVAVRNDAVDAVPHSNRAAMNRFELSIREQYTLRIPLDFEHATLTRLLGVLREVLC
jgi:transposase-like protein